MKRKGNITAYRHWAPDGVLWTEWVKPVLFAEAKTAKYNPDFQVKIPEITWIDSVAADTAIILDLPGPAGVEEGVALARMGYRPIPLYNGVNSVGAQMMTPTLLAGMVNVKDDTKMRVIDSPEEITTALFKYADEVMALNIEDDAPPVFMLDSNRMNKVKIDSETTYDSRWRVFPQDMPSAAFLQRQGIKKVIVRANTINDDLSHILLRYQKQGIVIRQCGENKQTRVIRIHRPSFFRNFLYRFGVTVGLRRNAAGGFGSSVMTAGGSG